MSIAIILLTLVIIIAFVFEYINGFHDSANAISTVISTKALSPRYAIVYAASLTLSERFLEHTLQKQSEQAWFHPNTLPSL